jgi:hypothetical protein
VVERQLPKLNVVGSIPIARSSFSIIGLGCSLRQQETLTAQAFARIMLPNRIRSADEISR